MQPFKRVFLFSDLHLTALDEPLGVALMRAMAELDGGGDALVLAGDVFEILVGNSSFFREKTAPFTRQLATLLSRGVSVFYLEGNHDFHLHGLLPEGVVIVSESVRIPVWNSSGEIKVLEVAHGDLVDSEDRSYLMMRRIFRSSLVRKGVEILPGKLIEGMARMISRDHDRKSSDLPESWTEERRHRLRSLFHADAERRRAAGADYVVMGHCHDLDEWGGFYWNMGYPPVHRQFLVYDSTPGVAKESIFRRYFLGF